jgi:hypothetical protein
MMNEGQVEQVDERGTEQDAHQEFTQHGRLSQPHAHITCEFCGEKNDGEQEGKLQECNQEQVFRVYPLPSVPQVYPSSRSTSKGYSGAISKCRIQDHVQDAGNGAGEEHDRQTAPVPQPGVMGVRVFSESAVTMMLAVEPMIVPLPPKPAPNASAHHKGAMSHAV